MAIGTALQNGSLVWAYDEKGRPLFSRGGRLHGYTAKTLSIIMGKTVFTYDEKGHILSSRPSLFS